MKKTLLLLTFLITLAIIFTACTSSKNNQTEFSTDNDYQSTKDYPIEDVWVYRYNVQTKSYEFAPCGYIDEYTSVVDSTDYDLVKLISGTYMYLGTIKGYQNEDKTIQIYQVKLPELSSNFTLTNDSIKLDYSGNSKMIEVEGWIYLDGTEIIAVSPLYNE